MARRRRHRPVELYGDFCTRYNGEQINIETVHDRYVSRSNGDVRQSETAGSSETFKAMCFGNKVAFAKQSGLNYKFIRARGESNGYDVDVDTVDVFGVINLGSNKKFTPEHQVDGTWAFLGKHGLYLNARGGASNWELVQRNDYVGAWSKFTVQ